MLACLCAHRAFFDPKLVAANVSAIYSPCFHFARDVPFAKRTHIDAFPGDNASVFDTKTVPARTAVMYLACAHATAHRRLTKRTHILEHFLGGLPSRQLCRRCVCHAPFARRRDVCCRTSCLRFRLALGHLAFCPLWLLRPGSGHLHLVLLLCHAGRDLFPDASYDLQSPFLGHCPCGTWSMRGWTRYTPLNDIRVHAMPGLQQTSQLLLSCAGTKTGQSLIGSGGEAAHKL